MKKTLEKFVLFLNQRYDITPNTLTYIRIFTAPWIALLISRILAGKSLGLAIVTLVFYFLIVSTDFLDGILARAISSKGDSHDHSSGGMFDRLGDKIFIIFVLIPFGLNLFTFIIILAESALAFQAIYSPSNKKQATKSGKLKMVLQTFLIPVLILQVVTNIIPDMVVYAYIIVTIISTCISVYSHYFYFKND